MWSRNFLAFGLISGVTVAITSLAAILLAVFTFEEISQKHSGFWQFGYAGVPGIVIYPVCWYNMIYRARHYSCVDVFRLPPLMPLPASSYSHCYLLESPGKSFRRRGGWAHLLYSPT